MTPAEGPTPRFAARPTLRPGEDITSFLARFAEANYLGFRELTGHLRTVQMWEDPPDDLIVRLASLTGVPPRRLRSATLRAEFPGAVLQRARTGRRYSRSPATCLRCGVDTVAARLNLVVLCPNCDCLLTDESDPYPLPPPQVLSAVQDDVIGTLTLAPTSSSARDRLQRLETLMAGLEPALWSNWPPLAPGESTRSRNQVVTWTRRILQHERSVARPPAVSATLLVLTWEASGAVSTTEEFLTVCDWMADPWEPAPDQMPDWSSVDEALTGMDRLLRQLDLRPEQVPTILRMPADPPILREHLRPLRTAQALALTQLAARAHGDPAQILGDGRFSGAPVSVRARRVAKVIVENVDMLRHLAVHAQRLHDDGRTDLARTRAELRTVAEVPLQVLTRLPSNAATFPHAGDVAAAWVWLDATRGRPAGGPHPVAAESAVLGFDAALDPEGRLLLREWWQARLDNSTEADLVAVRQVAKARSAS